MQTKMATGNDYLSEKKLWPFLQIIRHTIVVEEWALAHRHFLKTCIWDPRGLALGPAPNPRARGRPSTLILGHDITNKRLLTIFLTLNFFRKFSILYITSCMHNDDDELMTGRRQTMHGCGKVNCDRSQWNCWRKCYHRHHQNRIMMKQVTL